MAFEGKALDSIQASDILALRENAVTERKTLEYKRDLPGDSDADKREFLADVSSLANAAGGHLLLGIDASDGVPTSIPGIGVNNPDAEKLRLENIIRDGVSPRMPGIGMGMVPLSDGKHVPVIRVPRSWAGPHMVTFKNLSRFFSRNSAGKYQLDVGEIRAAFVSSESSSESLRNFRVQRISDIVSGQTPVSLPESGIAVLHSIPFVAGDRRPRFELSELRQAELLSLRTISGSVGIYRPNLDGLVGLRSSPNLRDYVQLFRTGAVEVVDSSKLREGPIPPMSPERTRWIRPIPFEEGILKALDKILEFQVRIGVEPPVLVSLSLLNAVGYEIFLRDGSDDDMGHPIDRDVIPYPEILIENLSRDQLPALLRPTFDSVWNSAGQFRSLNYDAQGNWIQRDS